MSVYLSLFILASYTISVCVRWGVPKSVSQTFFSITHKWIFSACVAASAGLLLTDILEILPTQWQWLGFLTVVGALFIAFAPNLQDELQLQTHMGGAVLLGLASQSAVLVLNPWLMLLWIAWIPFAFRENRIFWSEMCGGATLYASLITNM